MIDNILWLWGGFLVLALITEALTQSLVAVWFMPGALIALLLCFFKVQPWIGVLVFVIVTALMFLFMRPMAARLTKPRAIPTNADRVIGQRAKVIVALTPEEPRGQVRVLGQVWSARGEAPDAAFSVDEIVTVLRVEGVCLIVAPLCPDAMNRSASANEKRKEY